MGWIRKSEIPTGGVRVHSGRDDAYPEVTGYLVPTLLSYGERELAARLVRWLVSIQRADGSYADPDNHTPQVFDTGQVLRGLFAGAGLVPKALNAARRATDYLIGEMVEGGKGGIENRFSGSIPESALLYVLPPLYHAARVFHKPEYQRASHHCLDYYRNHSEALRITDLTHFLGYELEALLDLGLEEVAAPTLDALRERQADDGSLRGRGSADWVCTPGLAQVALCWYKTGKWEPADRAMSWLETHQEPSGGFLGSYGPRASYFPDVEVPWAAKFYLDAHLLRLVSFFDRREGTFPSAVSSDDGRAQALFSALRHTDRVLEVGSGNGRFLGALLRANQDIRGVGIDVAPSLLKHLPSDAVRSVMELIPFHDDSFDLVFSVEAIEHSANPKAALHEMIRVARPGGWIIVIDKERSYWGKLKHAPWERWPDTSELERLLNQGCLNVSVAPVSYDGESDGLMVAWRGQKRSRLSSSQWTTLTSGSGRDALVERVKRNRVSEWGQTLLLATAHGKRVLEIGSGSGEISLHLARGGRRVTALDLSIESLKLTREYARAIGVSLHTVLADPTHPMPFSDDMFDFTWSSGLLEHFVTEERRAMLREMARITAGNVITLVPNAACVAYRAGKAYQEERGTWPYGIEIPISSLHDDYEAAGLHVTSEFSVGAKHALSFLPDDHPLRRALSDWFETLPPDLLQDCNQGYLLVTIGSKRARGVSDPIAENE
ncbi:MAG: methyltransferase domain-containing protein [candidate division NC10 bacterium]